MTANPVIWKRRPCLAGECKGDRTKHWESIPFSTPYGLVTECFHCHKIRHIKLK